MDVVLFLEAVASVDVFGVSVARRRHHCCHLLVRFFWHPHPLLSLVGEGLEVLGALLMESALHDFHRTALAHTGFSHTHYQSFLEGILQQEVLVRSVDGQRDGVHQVALEIGNVGTEGLIHISLGSGLHLLGQMATGCLCSVDLGVGKLEGLTQADALDAAGEGTQVLVGEERSTMLFGHRLIL